MAGGATRRTSRVTSRTSRSGGDGGTRAGSAIGVFVGFALIALCLGGLLIYVREDGKRKAAELSKTVPVVSAAVDLPAGKVITAQDLVLKQVNPNSKETGAFEDINDPNLIGGTLKVGVLGGQTMLRNSIGEPEQKSIANPGEAEVTIVLKGVNAQQRYLQRERVVSVWRTFSTKGGNTIQKSLSKRARILEVIQSNSVVDNAQNNGEASATVTLAVSPSDATQINPYVNTSEISLQDGPDVEPPPSQVGLIELWEGIEPNPIEVNGEVEDSFSAPAATNT
jgi:Flp pilus assembly protein CpaB